MNDLPTLDKAALDRLTAIRGALSNALGSDFVSELARLEAALQAQYDQTLGRTEQEQVRLRFSISKTMEGLREIRRKIAQKEQLTVCLDTTLARMAGVPSQP